MFNRESGIYIYVGMSVYIYMDVGTSFYPLTFGSTGSEFHQEL